MTLTPQLHRTLKNLICTTFVLALFVAFAPAVKSDIITLGDTVSLSGGVHTDKTIMARLPGEGWRVHYGYSSWLDLNDGSSNFVGFCLNMPIPFDDEKTHSATIGSLSDLSYLKVQQISDIVSLVGHVYSQAFDITTNRLLNADLAKALQFSL
ncbi:MAG: hypothetical protein ACRC2T_03700 [Thermoguttaceae bacterium]